MFFTKYVRGRPKFPVWDPSVPLYVCEHRYKDELKSFKKIKNWASCVPEEIRAHEYPFELWSDGRTDILKRVRSPFVRGVVGPGGIGEAIENEEEEQARYHVLPGGEPATVQKLRAAKEAEEANQREELQRSVLYGGNPATSTPAAVPNFSGQQPRAQVFAPATTLGFTLAEAAIRTESFQPLPPSIRLSLFYSKLKRLADTLDHMKRLSFAQTTLATFCGLQHQLLFHLFPNDLHTLVFTSNGKPNRRRNSNRPLRQCLKC